MDIAIQGISLIAVVSLAHERVLELIRWLSEKLVPSAAARNLITALTGGPPSAVFGIALAYGTHADLFAAFRAVGGTNDFMATYLTAPPTDPRGIVGCFIMGLALTLGSAFWHDLAKSLVDLRGKLQQPQGVSAGPTTRATTTLLRPPASWKSAGVRTA